MANWSVVILMCILRNQFNAKLVTEDPSHPVTSHFSKDFFLFDEIYQVMNYSRDGQEVCGLVGEELWGGPRFRIDFGTHDAGVGASAGSENVGGSGEMGDGFNQGRRRDAPAETGKLSSLASL